MPPSDPSPVAVVLHRLQRSLEQRDLPQLSRLLTLECRTTCRGFIPHVVDPAGDYEAATWVPRLERGGLLVDLARVLLSYERLRVRVIPLDMRSFGGRVLLRTRLALAGPDMEGYLRTDEGVMDLDLRQGPAGWRIHALWPDGVQTLRRETPGYSAPRALSGVTGSSRGSDLALPGSHFAPPWAALDVDGDGRIDLVTAHEGHVVLLRQRAGGGFEGPRPLLAARDVRVIRAGDLDGDGRADLFVGSYGQTSGVWRSAGRGFQPMLGSRVAGHVTDAAIADFTGDGRLDLYVVRHGEGVATWEPGQPNLLFVGTDRGLVYRREAEDRGWGLAACGGDLDGDGDVDLFVANEQGPSRLYVNQGGHLTDGGRVAGLDGVGMATACAVGDVNGDGRLDLLVGGRRAHEAYRYGPAGLHTPGDGLVVRGRYRDALQRAMVGDVLLVNTTAPGRALGFVAEVQKDAGWTTWAGLHDHDSDGRLDPLLLRGSPPPAEERRWWWQVMGSILRRERPPSLRGSVIGQPARLWLRVGRSAGMWIDGAPVAFGERAIPRARSALVFPLEGGGSPALLLTGEGPPGVRVWRASEEAGHFVLLELGAAVPNVHAVGSRVELWAEGRRQVRQVGLASGLPGGPPGLVHFGVGRALRASRVVVCWPDGARQEFADLPVDRRVMLRQGGHARWRWDRTEAQPQGSVAAPEGAKQPIVAPLVANLLQLTVQQGTATVPLATHAGSGGTLLLFVGAGAEAERICATLARRAGGWRVLVVRLDEGELRCPLPSWMASSETRRALAPWQGLLPLLAVVDGRGETRRLLSAPSEIDLRQVVPRE